MIYITKIDGDCELKVDYEGKNIVIRNPTEEMREKLTLFASTEDFLFKQFESRTFHKALRQLDKLGFTYDKEKIERHIIANNI